MSDTLTLEQARIQWEAASATEGGVMIWFIVGLTAGGIVGFALAALLAFGNKQDSL